MQNIIERRGVRQFVKFGVVGASSTAIDWALYLVMTRFLGVFYLIAKIISFAVSVINSYIWNRRWTFRSKEPKKLHEFSKFMMVALIGLGLNTLIMFLAVEKFKLHDIIGLALATAIVMSWNFIANKYFTFKEVVL
jgi:putative flippase GtrA